MAEDYLAYSDEQWRGFWDEIEEMALRRAIALSLRLLANRFKYTHPHLSQRYERGCTRALGLSDRHLEVAYELRQVAEEAETASHIVFEQAEQRCSS